MSLHVVERKESTDSVLERVIEYRPGWLKMDYQYRPEDLRRLNVVEYVTNYGIPVSKSRTALTNYRYYYDMVRFSELCADPSIDQQVAAEMRNMPKGADVATWFLENYQLKACAFCAKREGKLLLCAGTALPTAALSTRLPIGRQNTNSCVSRGRRGRRNEHGRHAPRCTTRAGEMHARR